MFERFTDETCDVVVAARAEAVLMHHPRVGTEHLLIALAGEPEVIALGFDAERARAEVVRTVGLGVGDHGESIPFTAAAKESMETALTEAMRMGHAQIHPGHLLLAVLKQRDGIARRILVAAGAVLTDMRAAIARRLRVPGVAVDPSVVESTVVTSALARALLGGFGTPDVDAQLLDAILRGGGPVSDWLRARGVTEDALRRFL